MGLLRVECRVAGDGFTRVGGAGSRRVGGAVGPLHSGIIEVITMECVLGSRV